MPRTALCLLLLLAPVLRADDALPWHPSQPGYHDATVALAEYCLEHKLHSEALLLLNGVSAERATEIARAATGQPDEYTAESWGGYLDRLEVVQRRRAQAALEAGTPAADVLSICPDFGPALERAGFKELKGMGWLKSAEHERLAPLAVALQDAPAKQDREATWQQPWVIITQHFCLVTDLPWSRARKYAEYLDRFHAVYFETVGDVVPGREHPNVVWCCKDSSTFVEFTKSIGFAMTADNGGLHVGYTGAVYVNAERCDFVGRKNKSWDNLARTLFHECAHRLTEIGLRGRRGGNDAWGLAYTKEHAWIVEAIAILFEDLQLQAKGYKLKGLEQQRLWTIKDWKAKDGRIPSLGPIFKQGQVDFAQGTPISSTEKYALCGSVAWYCLFEKKEHRKAFLTLLVDYYRTDTRRFDFEKRFSKSLPDFEAEWKAWVAR
ncbi:MAG: hypothetical protein KF696_09915 [Planctomycetes bacterium]|nr:hypothetical protein [Planctomycetota bacterium]MCW8136173.1 hypothetical protein [Planctomycetota bacterium]